MVRTVSRPRRYLFAIALIAAAAALRLALQGWVDAPFLTFFAAVIATAWVLGIGPSVLAIALSSVAGYMVVAPERLAATESNPYGLVPRFVIASVVMAWLIDRLRRAQQLSAERLAVQLESAQRAEDAQTRLAAIVESTGDAIMSTALDGTLLSWNRGAERLYGFTPAEAIGSPIDLIVPPDRMAEERAVLSRIRNGRADRRPRNNPAAQGRLVDPRGDHGVANPGCERRHRRHVEDRARHHRTAHRR